jgi:hypothetical protein
LCRKGQFCCGQIAEHLTLLLIDSAHTTLLP